MGKYTGLRPAMHDIIITGRSLYDECVYTHEWLKERDIRNLVFFNPVKFEEKTRENAGEHKANMINLLETMGCKIGLHFEDDPVQADIIEKNCPHIKVVRVVHDLVEKENVWHGPTKHERSVSA